MLDLFAGTGGLGIEALSRGGASAVFVEKDARAAEVIARNFARTRLQGEVKQMDVFSYLDRVAKPGAFDIIFADPPYAKAPGRARFPGRSCSLPFRCLRLWRRGGIFVLEKLPPRLSPKKRGECAGNASG